MRNLQNFLQAEPHKLAGMFTMSALYTHSLEITEIIEVMKNYDMERFLDMKALWLSKLTLTWLVMGHLSAD